MSINVSNIKNTFFQQFNHQPSHLVQAPARVNLIGEHTDYNDGFVLPCAINYQTVVACRARDDSTINVYAMNYDELDSFTISDTIAHSATLWANYVRGVVQFLRRRGYQFMGADLVIIGDVPQGAGLSSSASLEVAIGQALQSLYNLDISKADIALNGQQAENEFVGCNCGIMDQMISAQGEENNALLIDCRSLETTAITMPQSLAVMIINSNKQRGLVDSEYNTRRKQCETASQKLSVKALRDASLDDLLNSDIDNNDEVFKRAYHVITENQRTLDMTQALQQQDLKKISQLMAQSHASMRDDFAITVAEIDYLVEIISEVIGDKGGVRMTGGGFGGCVVALVPHDLVDDVTAVINDKYYKQTGLTADIYLCTACNGAGEL